MWLNSAALTALRHNPRPVLFVLPGTRSDHRSHRPKTAHAAGKVVTNPTSARVAPMAFRCSGLSRSAKKSAIPAPSITRVLTMNASSGRLRRVSFITGNHAPDRDARQKPGIGPASIVPSPPPAGLHLTAALDGRKIHSCQNATCTGGFPSNTTGCGGASSCFGSDGS